MKLTYKILLLIAPFLFILGFYVITDPFKVIYKYHSYYQAGKQKINGVFLNKDYVSTETFLQNYSAYKYDSYIFGSSRSIFYPVSDWEKYIKSDRCFHFDASGESLYGVFLKFKFLQEKKVNLKNALIIVDYELLKTTNDYTDYLKRKDPVLSGSGWLSFQYCFLKTFFDERFLMAYMDYKISGVIKPYMASGFILDDRPGDYDSVKNEGGMSYYEDMIKKDPRQFYESRQSLFPPRDTTITYAKRTIFSKQKMMLSEIHNILKANNTCYRIVISPLYDQKKIDKDDLEYLKQLFGENTVFDFSGINDITKNVQNYYENSHYRPHVAGYILSKIYENNVCN